MTDPQSQPRQPAPGMGPPKDHLIAALQIVGGSNAKNSALTRAQKRFNQLVKKIKTVRVKIERFKEADQELRALGQQIILPAEEKFLRALRDLVLTMHSTPHQSKLSTAQRRKLRQVMELEISMLLRTTILMDDEKLKQLFGHYSKSGASFEEIQEAAAKAEQEAAAQMFGMFGMDLDPEILDDPEKLKEVLDARAEELREKEAAEEVTQKKSKAQLETESKRQSAADAVKKTTRQIYLDLVKHCHPDREPDELKRVEKTEWMKQITAAYEVDDHLRLLELQMTLLTERENAFADFNDGELSYFNESLQRQLQELEAQLEMSHPLQTGNMFGSLYHPNRNIMLREMEMERSSLLQRTQLIARNAQLISSEQGFKRYIVDYQMPRPYGRDSFDLESMFR